TGNLAVKRDLSDVRDVVQAYRLLVETGQPGEVYNICTGRSVAIEEVARRLLKFAGLDLPLVVDPALLRPIDVPDMRGDPDLLRTATGWRSTIPLDQTLTDVLAYWQSVTPAPNP